MIDLLLFWVSGTFTKIRKTYYKNQPRILFEQHEESLRYITTDFAVARQVGFVCRKNRQQKAALGIDCCDKVLPPSEQPCQ